MALLDLRDTPIVPEEVPISRGIPRI